MKLKSFVKTSIKIIILAGAVSLTSCSHTICSAYARSSDRSSVRKRVSNFDKGAFPIPTPFSSKYRYQL